MIKPTMREVKVILGDENFHGWNDKRKNGGRIKILRETGGIERGVLARKLQMLFPKFEFNVRSTYYCGPATLIYFKQVYQDYFKQVYPD